MRACSSGFHVAQVGFKLCYLSSPDLHSPGAGVTGVHDHVYWITELLQELFPCRDVNNQVPASCWSSTINLSGVHQSPPWEANEITGLTYREGLCTEARLSKLLNAQCKSTSSTAGQMETQPLLLRVHCFSSTSQHPEAMCTWGRTPHSGWLGGAGGSGHNLRQEPTSFSSSSS